MCACATPFVFGVNNEEVVDWIHVVLELLFFFSTHDTVFCCKSFDCTDGIVLRVNAAADVFVFECLRQGLNHEMRLQSVLSMSGSNSCHLTLHSFGEILGTLLWLLFTTLTVARQMLKIFADNTM